MTQAAWARAPERGSPWLMRLTAWLSLTLGRAVTRPLLWPVAGYFLLFSPASRRASRGYLGRVLGRAAGWREVCRHFHCFASTIHDRIFLVSGRLHGFEVAVHGEQALAPMQEAGRGLFLVGGHLGSFEALHAVAGPIGKLRAVMVMHEENARKVNAMLAAVQRGAARDIIPLGKVDAMLRVSERLAQGCAIGMLADRSPAADARQAVPFLGGEARFPLGTFRMAALLQCPVVFMAGLYLGGNRYAIHFEPLADFSTVTSAARADAVGAAVTRYAAVLERYCRLAPYNWFNFFDFWRADAPGALAA
jgi:predicted LPLAT superfamily acyltransferase